MNPKHRTEKLRTKNQKDIEPQKNKNKGSKKPKEWVENAVLHNSVLNKIMATRE